MSPTKIKICCIGSSEEAELAVQAGADAIGFIGGIPSSIRAIDLQAVAAITSSVLRPTETFLLTSEYTAEVIAQQVLLAGASTVQIVSYPSTAEYEKLRKLMPTTLRAQVIHVEDESALDLIEQYAPYVNLFLLDSGRPSLSTPEYGGTGRTHDWSISSEFVRRSPHPVYLAGGLSPENVAEAIGVVRPAGVDLCSGVRTNGLLDAGKLKAFINTVRRSDAVLSVDSNL